MSELRTLDRASADLPLPDLGRPAWIQQELGNASGQGLRVAVIDSGRDASWHDPRILRGFGLVDDDHLFELRRSDDDHDRIGHGTACIDILLGLAPAVEVLPIRVFGSRLETSPEMILAAINAAIEAGADIINLSLGYRLKRALRELYLACERARDADAVVVSAVHLEDGWSYPAVFDNTIGVTAGRFDTPFDFEYFADEGVECQAQGDREVRWLGGERRRVYGSSFAAAHVSALIALLIERFANRDLDLIRAHLARLSHRERQARMSSSRRSNFRSGDAPEGSSETI